MAEEKLNKFIINYLTEEQYIAAQQAGLLNDNDFYCTPTNGNGDAIANTIQQLLARIENLELRVAALEDGEIKLAANPTDTSEMDLWIQTS